MQRYKNLNGDSGVTAYESQATSIRIQFQEGAVYLYDYQSAGKKNIETMKKLAASGKGLSTFISQEVQERYAAKLQ
jgi:hypothetical protein